MRTITGTVLYTEHHGPTMYGNPMVSVHLVSPEVDGVSEHGTYRISDNASIAYGIDNAEYRDTAHTFALTRAGRISHVVRSTTTRYARDLHTGDRVVLTNGDTVTLTGVHHPDGNIVSLFWDGGDTTERWDTRWTVTR
jgi:hypothetical protein